MNTELARDLQYRITKEALAMLVIHGSAAETKDYERAIILISSRPNYMMAYGACTYIEDASGLWVTSQTSRVLRSYVEHHPDRRMVELQAHPLPIPDKVDSWLVATVC